MMRRALAVITVGLLWPALGFAPAFAGGSGSQRTLLHFAPFGGSSGCAWGSSGTTNGSSAILNVNGSQASATVIIEGATPGDTITVSLYDGSCDLLSTASVTTNGRGNATVQVLAAPSGTTYSVLGYGSVAGDHFASAAVTLG